MLANTETLAKNENEGGSGDCYGTYYIEEGYANCNGQFVKVQTTENLICLGNQWVHECAKGQIIRYFDCQGREIDCWDNVMVILC